jgi:putative transposase
MGYPKSTLYYRESIQDRPPTAAELEDARLTDLIREIHQASFGTYGSPRVAVALRERGEVVNHKRVQRLMRDAGIQGVSRRRSGRSKAATVAASERIAQYPVDLVKRSFTVNKPDALWFADITEHPLVMGFSTWLAS